MKKNNSLYNKPDTLGIVSLYPKKGELYSTGTSGVASFAKNTATHASKQIVVFAEYTDKPCTYTEKNVLIVRCFKKGSPFMWLQILKTIRKTPLIKNLLFQFDFALYGGIVTSSLFLPFLAILKCLNYKTNVQIHSAVDNVFKLHGHIGLNRNILGTAKGHVLNFIFKTFYLLLGVLTTQVIVAEEVLKTKLKLTVAEEKIVVIPHGVDTELKPIDKNKAKELLGIDPKEQVVIFFGFINWFKGADLFVKAYKDVSALLGKKVRFIIAGGESATLKNQPYYKEYFADTIYSIEESKHVSMTGFVPQDKIHLYFSAADLVVFPYRYLFCASGVLSLVFSYGKPFIVSKALSEIFRGQDMKAIFESVDLRIKDVSFALNKKSCLKTTETVLRNGLKKKMILVTEMVRATRNWDKTSDLYMNAIFAPSVNLGKQLSLGYTE